MCIWKKFGGYKVGQQLGLKACDVGKRKNSWAYNSTSGLISHMSDREEWLNFCVSAKSFDSGVRVRIMNCDAQDPLQVWDFDPSTGHISLRADRNVCMMTKTMYDGIGSDDDNWLKTTNKCVSNTFGAWE